MILQEYITMLQEWLDKNPQAADLQVAMLEDGYYSEGPFADLFHTPEVTSVEVDAVDEIGDPVFYKSTYYGREVTYRKKDKKSYVVLGHSSQNY